MTLGEQLKLLRQQRSLSQPELADKMGIEQSYLSKLENGKSTPSNEIFRKILLALEVELPEFLAQFSHAEIMEQMKSISDVEHFLLQQDQSQFESRRRYLLVSSLLIVIASTLFYVGFSKQVFSEVRYQYSSPGVILDGEPASIFRKWTSFFDVDRATPEGQAAYTAKHVEMEMRKDVQALLLAEHVGDSFFKVVEGGKRQFAYPEEVHIAQVINAVLQAIAVFLFSCGVMGFVLERRLFNKD